jgi:hypothetical protein
MSVSRVRTPEACDTSGRQVDRSGLWFVGHGRLTGGCAGRLLDARLLGDFDILAPYRVAYFRAGGTKRGRHALFAPLRPRHWKWVATMHRSIRRILARSSPSELSACRLLPQEPCTRFAAAITRTRGRGSRLLGSPPGASAARKHSELAIGEVTLRQLLCS